MKKKIYIAGAITGVKDYKETFNSKAVELKEEGYEVLNPVAYDYEPVFDYMSWIKHGLFLLDLADEIYMLPGWKKSKGARLEYAYAECKGIKIRHGIMQITKLQPGEPISNSKHILP